ncbi:hypothetical protein TNCV_3265551 [Trichonephila clavipes]|nr:hypothetical protein TNCV_3265551 [Trichonephila clavipes]
MQGFSHSLLYLSIVLEFSSREYEFQCREQVKFRWSNVVFVRGCAKMPTSIFIFLSTCNINESPFDKTWPFPHTRSVGMFMIEGHSGSKCPFITDNSTYCEWLPRPSAVMIFTRTGNDHAGFLDKKGTLAIQRPARVSTFNSLRLFSNMAFKHNFKMEVAEMSKDKNWVILNKNSPWVPRAPRKAGVAHFILLTGHNCLRSCEAPARGCPCSPLSTRPVSVGKDEESRKSLILISVY